MEEAKTCRIPGSQDVHPETQGACNGGKGTQDKAAGGRQGVAKMAVLQQGDPELLPGCLQLFRFQRLSVQLCPDRIPVMDQLLHADIFESKCNADAEYGNHAKNHQNHGLSSFITLILTDVPLPQKVRLSFPPRAGTFGYPDVTLGVFLSQRQRTADTGTKWFTENRFFNPCLEQVHDRSPAP